MARIRTVKPEFWQHPKVTRVSRDARLLFLGLLNEVDDEGKTRYLPKTLAGVLFPEDEDVDASWVSSRMDELERVGLVRRYEIDGAPLLIVCGFTEHQKVSHPTPSRLPDPPEPLGRDSREIPEPVENPPESFVPDMEQGNGKEEEEEEEASLALAVVEPTISVRDVFDFWRAECDHPRAVLDDQRRRRIEWAIKTYPPDDIRDAILGAASSEFHQGQNDNGRVYDDITLICRNAEKFERFRDGYRRGPVQKTPRHFGAIARAVARAGP